MNMSEETKATDNKRIRILLVDDHGLFRKGVSSLLASQKDMEVVGEAGDGLAALSKVRETMPDLVLMDIRMPRCDGLKATKLILQEFPYVRIVMLTVSDEEEDLFEAIKAGAQGYLLKDLSPETLFEFIRGVVQGEVPLSPPVAARILHEFRLHYCQKNGTSASRRDTELSQRERQILQMIVAGASNQEIARSLVIAPGTVKNHIHNMLTKLHLRTRAQAAVYAVQEGLAQPPGPRPGAN